MTQPLCLLFILLCIVACVSASASVSFNSVQYPIFNANLFKAQQERYYLFLPALDSPRVDFCQVVDQQSTVVKMMVAKSIFELNNTAFPSQAMIDLDCMQYFCLDSSFTANFTRRMSSSEVYRNEFSFLFNHCFLCNSPSALNFRDAISAANHTCKLFPTSHEKMMTMMNAHCLTASGLSNEANLTTDSGNNQVMAIEGTKSGVSYGVMDAHFFEAISVYQIVLSKIIPTDPSKDTLALFMNVMFPLANTSYFSATSLPMQCHCAFSQDYAFRCYDINHKFLAAFKFSASPIYFLAITLVCGAFFLVGVVIPRTNYILGVLMKKGHFKKDEAFYFDIPNKPIVLQYLKAIYLLTIVDIKSHIVLWNSLLFICSIFTCIFSFLRNFTSPIQNFAIDDVGGTCRAFAFLSLALCFCSMIVHWSHTIDLIKTNKTKALPNKLNTLLTLGFYLFIACFLIAGVVSAAVTKQTTLFFSLLSILYTSLSLIFCIGFTLAGVAILIRMKKTTANIVSIKLTKSTMVMNISNLLLAVAAGISIATYFMGWDIFTVELGLLRSFVYDVLLLHSANCVTYILFTPMEWSLVFGQRSADFISSLLNCDFLTREKPNQIPENKHLKSIKQEQSPSSSPSSARLSTASDIEQEKV